MVLVAYGEAASLILQAHQKPNHPKLVALIAYYPDIIPKPSTKYPPGVRVLVHLAGKEIKTQHNPEVLGLSTSKTKLTSKRIDPGAGYGETLEFGFQTYTYSGLEPGFAERDLDEYDAVAEKVAFTRSLSTLRKAFRIETAIEHTRDTIVDQTASGAGGKAVEKSMHEGAQVLFGPTLTGGVGKDDLKRFYTDYFHPLPPNFRSRLLSRTLGTDGSRLVDELYISFTHSCPIPWLLPGVPPTEKRVEVVLVSIVRFVGGKLESEHLYWDQASVLVQVGILSPKMVPEKWKKKGVEELPIWGCEGARAVKRGSSLHINELVEGWDG